RHTRWPRDWSSDVCSSDLADATRLGMTTPAAPDNMSAALLTRPRSTWRTLAPDSACESRECPTPAKGLDKTAKPMAPVPETRYKIGRASCRERVESWV